MAGVVILFLGVAASVASALPVLQGVDDKLSARYPMETRSSLRAHVTRALGDALQAEQIPPAFVACSRDLSGCPRGFSDMGASTCVAPAHYTGECASPIDFGGLTPKEKILLADSCGVNFSCLDQHCDYSRGCPMGWTSAGESCVAPSSYNGPCASPTKFSHLSDEGKDEWAMKCGVSFCK
jgi:CPW-WPC domain-containing protein